MENYPFEELANLHFVSESRLGLGPEARRCVALVSKSSFHAPLLQRHCLLDFRISAELASADMASTISGHGKTV